MLAKKMVVLICGLVLSLGVYGWASTVAYFGFETDGGSAVSNNQSAVTVDDTSGGGRDFSAGSGSAAPTYKDDVASLAKNPDGSASSYSMYFDQGDYAKSGIAANPYQALKNLPQGDFTIEAWIKVDSSITHRNIIYGSYNDGSEYNLNFEILDGSTLGKLRAYLDGPGAAADLVSNSTVNDGQWHHVAMVRYLDYNQSGTGRLELWIDGQLDKSGSESEGAYTCSNFPYLGRDLRTDTSRWFEGYMDSVRLSGAALGADDFLIIPEPATIGLMLMGLTGLIRKR